jgi:hypothetical protein
MLVLFFTTVFICICSLSGNSIGREGMKALLPAIRFALPSMLLLDLRGNGLFAEANERKKAAAAAAKAVVHDEEELELEVALEKAEREAATVQLIRDGARARWVAQVSTLPCVVEALLEIRTADDTEQSKLTEGVAIDDELDGDAVEPSEGGPVRRFSNPAVGGPAVGGDAGGEVMEQGVGRGRKPSLSASTGRGRKSSLNTSTGWVRGRRGEQRKRSVQGVLSSAAAAGGVGGERARVSGDAADGQDRGASTLVSDEDRLLGAGDESELDRGVIKCTLDDARLMVLDDMVADRLKLLAQKSVMKEREVGKGAGSKGDSGTKDEAKNGSAVFDSDDSDEEDEIDGTASAAAVADGEPDEVVERHQHLLSDIRFLDMHLPGGGTPLHHFARENVPSLVEAVLALVTKAAEEAAEEAAKDGGKESGLTTAVGGEASEKEEESVFGFLAYLERPDDDGVPAEYVAGTEVRKLLVSVFAVAEVGFLSVCVLTILLSCCTASYCCSNQSARVRWSTRSRTELPSLRRSWRSRSESMRLRSAG